MTPLLPTLDHYLFNLLAMNSSEAKRIRNRAIKEHWGHKCVYCGLQTDSLTIDHVRPKCKGGTDETSNLLPSCQQCNRSKGSNNWLQFLRETFGLDPQKEQLILNWIN